MNSTTTQLLCPKCQAPMRSYERSGITIDQCTECRGIFLDRGELERLIDTESDSQPDVDEHHPEHHRQTPSQGQPRKKRRGSFLSDLFE
jgi:uncharacterized protein